MKTAQYRWVQRSWALKYFNCKIARLQLSRWMLAMACALIVCIGAFPEAAMAQFNSYGPPAPGSRDALGLVLGAQAPGVRTNEDAARLLLSMQMGAGANTSSTFNPLTMMDAVGNVVGSGGGSGLNGGGRTQTGTQSENKGGLSTALNIMVVLTVVSLAPSIMLMTTSFVRIIIVLGLLKQAMGTATIPPPQVTTALAMFMTVLVMAPTMDRINKEAIVPYRAGEISNYDELWSKARQPMRDFMFAQIEATGNWSSVYMVLERRGVDVSDPSKLTRADVDMVALIPAYMLSELKTAFLMGFRLYLPFLVIDMVISTMLISMSMMMLPPVLISLPFKLLLFVLVDGWTLIVGSLMAGFAQPIAGDPSVATAMIDGVHAVVGNWGSGGGTSVLAWVYAPHWSLNVIGERVPPEAIEHGARLALGHVGEAIRHIRVGVA